MSDKNKMPDICERCGADAEWHATWQRPGGPIRNVGVPEGLLVKRLYCSAHIGDVIQGNNPPREVQITRRAADRRRRAMAKIRKEERQRYFDDQLVVPGTEVL